jgi:hypothetical protein
MPLSDRSARSDASHSTRAAAALAVAVLWSACGPRPIPDSGPVPPPRPPSPTAIAGAPPAGRPVLVGEMCPGVAAGRAAVRPLFRRASGWTDQAAEVTAPVERWQARQFAVLGWNGRRAGLFAVAGSAAVDGVAAAIGAYAGGSPCEKPRGAGGAAGERDAECVAALKDCGLAVAEVAPRGGFEAAPADEEPVPIELAVGGACAGGGKLLVDIDDDGVREAYPLAALVDASGGPTESVEAAPLGPALGGARPGSAGAAPVDGGPSCKPRFAARQLAPGVDLIGVLDLDADGRKDIVLAFARGGRPVWALYAATASAGRLDRVAVAAPWAASTSPQAK